MMQIGIHEATGSRESSESGDCAGVTCAAEVAQALSLLGARWAAPVLVAMRSAKGPTRFRELQRRVGGISQKELAKQLASFVRHGMADRRGPLPSDRGVEYALTDMGIALLRGLDGLGRHLKAPIETSARERPTPRSATWVDVLDRRLASRDLR